MIKVSFSNKYASGNVYNRAEGRVIKRVRCNQGTSLDEHSPIWSSDGNFVFYIRKTGKQDEKKEIWKGDAEGNSATFSAGVCCDGSKVAFVTCGSGKDGLDRNIFMRGFHVLRELWILDEYILIS